MTNGICSFLGLAFLAVSAAGILGAAPSEYAGKQIVSIAFDPASQPLEVDQLALLLPFSTGDKLQLDKVRQAIDRLYGTGRYSDISVDAADAVGGVALRIITKPTWFVGQVLVEGVPEPPNKGQIENSTKLVLGAPYADQDLDRAVENLRSVLRNNGFYVPIIRPVITRRPERESVEILFEVQPGPRARFSRPIIRGDPISSIDEIIRATGWRRWFGLRGWKSVTDNRLQQGLEGVRGLYLKRDHLLARVQLENMEYDSEQHTLTPTIAVEAGPRVSLRTEGAKLSKGKLRQLVPIYQEQSVDRDLLLEGVRNLEDYFQSEGYFDAKVTFREDRGDSGQSIIYRIDRGARYKLVHLDVSGNRYFDASTIRERLSVTPATAVRYRRGRYSEELLEQDKARIIDLYRSNGFRDVKVASDVESDYQAKEREIAVFLKIEEGPQWFVSELSVNGVDLRLLPEVEGLVQSSAGQPYSGFNVATDRDNILNYYFNHGYPDARFDFTAAPGVRPNTMKLVYTLDEGRRNFVRDVIINGLDATNRSLVANRLTLKPGNPLSQAEMVEAQRRLYDLGIFAKVDMAVQNPDGRERNKYVLYDFEEGSRYSMSLGLGAEIARIGGGDANSLSSPGGAAGFSPRVSLGVSRNNFMGIGHTLGVVSRLSNIQKRMMVNYLAPQFSGDQNKTLSFYGLWDDSRNIRTFTSRRWEGSAQFGQRLSLANTLQYRLTYRRVTVDETSLNIRRELIPALAQPARVGLASMTFIQDRRDDPVDSHRGIYNTFDVGVAARALASQPQYVRLLLKNATYHRIGREAVLARSVSFGWLYNYGAAEIPLPERFFAGGSASHRGFPENQAGPRDTVTGFPLGGNAYFVSSIEYRFPLIGQSLGGVLFHDAGNVYSSLDKISLRYHQRNLQDFDYMVQSVGFGFRYRTPIGPLRLDLAFAPNAPRFVGFEGTREELLLGGGKPDVLQRISRFQFHFSIGQTF